MNEINSMLDNIESQLGRKNYNTVLYNNFVNLNIPLRNKTNLYLNNLDYEALNNNNYYISNKYYDNNNYNNFKYKSNNNQLDKISNGGKDYGINIPYNQKIETNKPTKTEIEPFSNNIHNEFEVSLNNAKTQINILKNKENDLDFLKSQLYSINKKLSEYNKDLTIIENNNQQTKRLLENTSNDNKMNENIINN